MHPRPPSQVLAHFCQADLQNIEIQFLKECLRRRHLEMGVDPCSPVNPGGLPLITYAPRGRGGVKAPIHFHCVLHAKRGGGGPDSMYNCVRT